MSAHAVITHALTPGTRMHYTGTQSWGPRNVTVIKAWGGRVDPLYVVRPDGMGEHCTYVVSEGELRPVRPVSLGKASDRYPVGSGVIMVPSAYALDWRRSLRGADVDWAMHMGPIGVGSAMDRNDLRALSVVLGLCARGFGRA